MYNFKNFILLENKKFHKELKNKRKLIEKFLGLDYIIDFVLNNITNNNNDNRETGLKYVVWFTDRVLKKFKKEYLDKAYNNKKKIYSELKLLNKKEFDEYIKTGNITKNISDKEKGDIYASIHKIWSIFQGSISKYFEIKDWLISPLRKEKLNLKELSLDDALEKSKKWHEELEIKGVIEYETGTKIMEFDDGFYWIDLEESYCEAEAESMGHCASTDADTLLSLRKDSISHITIALNYGSRYSQILQCKGKKNSKPKKEYYKYIIELLKAPNINKKFVTNFNKNDIGRVYPVGLLLLNEYKPEIDFQLDDLSDNEFLDVINSNKELKNHLKLKDKLKLVEKGIFTNEDIANTYKDLIYENNKFIFLLNNFNDLSSNIFEYGEDYLEKREILDILNFEYNDFNDYEFDYSYWVDLTKETKQLIIEFCINNIYIIEYYDYEKKEYIILTLDKDNIYLKNNIIYLKINNSEIKLQYMLYNEIYKENNISIEYSEFKDLIDILNNVYDNEKNRVDDNAAYKSVLKQLEDYLGKITIKDKIYCEIDLNYVARFDTGSFDNILAIFNYDLVDSYKELRFEIIDKNFNGKIDIKILNEKIQSGIELKLKYD